MVTGSRSGPAPKKFFSCAPAWRTCSIYRKTKFASSAAKSAPVSAVRMPALGTLRCGARAQNRQTGAARQQPRRRIFCRRRLGAGNRAHQDRRQKRWHDHGARNGIYLGHRRLCRGTRRQQPRAQRRRRSLQDLQHSGQLDLGLYQQTARLPFSRPRHTRSGAGPANRRWISFRKSSASIPSRSV